jgi:hypothetical protein
MADRRLALVRELEQADEASAAELTELDELYAACEAVRTRALELEAFLARLPEERAAARGAVAEARGLEDERRRAAGHAARELRDAEGAGDPERLAAARRFDVRARDALHIAERRRGEAEERSTGLEREAEAAQVEAEELARRAAGLAGALAERPRLGGDAGTPPAGGLAGIADWGTQARAALLVARGQLAAERDAIVRQANELAAVLLGESLPAASVAGVLHEVERRLD